MKRTLAISLWLALGTSAFGQNPTVVAKPAQTLAKANAANTQNASGKPSPTTVKVVPVNGQKPAAAVPAKPATVQAKPAVVAVKPAMAPAQVAKTNSTPGTKTVAVTPAKAPAAAQSHGPVVVAAKPVSKGATKQVDAAKTAHDPFKKDKKEKKQAVKLAKPATTTVAVKEKPEEKKPEAKKINVAGRRDPFISPVVSMGAVGSGCSSGKRCLAIDQIALKGIVRSDTGMIAVVVNAMDKAYFLRENDPVFNGYVVKITGDSIVFQENYHDRLGKPLTRDVTKTIIRPTA